MKDNVTVDKLLTDDDRKAIAEKLLDGSITDVLIVYSGENGIHWQTTYPSTHVLGIAHLLTMDTVASLESDKT